MKATVLEEVGSVEFDPDGRQLLVRWVMAGEIEGPTCCLDDRGPALTESLVVVDAPDGASPSSGLHRRARALQNRYTVVQMSRATLGSGRPLGRRVAHGMLTDGSKSVGTSRHGGNGAVASEQVRPHFFVPGDMA